MQYNAIQCNTMQYNTIHIQYNAMQYNAIQYNAKQCNANNTIQYNIHMPIELDPLYISKQYNKLINSNKHKNKMLSCMPFV